MWRCSPPSAPMRPGRSTRRNTTRMLVSGSSSWRTCAMPSAAARSCCFYQPILDLASGTVTGAEALARWRHPSRGVLAPAAFLGLVADAGLMGPFTMDVLDQALVQQSRWSMAGYDIGVSVNISAASLRDDELPDKIAATDREARVSTRAASPSRSPRTASSPTPSRHCSSWSGCAASASSSRSTTSAPGSPRSPTFAGYR